MFFQIMLSLTEHKIYNLFSKWLFFWSLCFCQLTKIIIFINFVFNTSYCFQVILKMSMNKNYKFYKFCFLYQLLFSGHAYANKKQNVKNIVFPFYINMNRKLKRVQYFKVNIEIYTEKNIYLYIPKPKYFLAVLKLNFTE